MVTAAVAFVNGRVFAGDGEQPRASAVAIADGVILAVGTDDEVRQVCSPSTEVIDLRSRLLLAGFQDVHVHPASAGLDLERCNLLDLDSAAAARDRIAGYAAANPDEAWVLGAGWAMDWYPGGVPTATELDRLVSDRPAYLRNRDGHGAWVNSRALEMAGIDGGTADPPDGRIERSADGTATGTLHEGAMGLVERILPPVTVEDHMRGLRAAQAHLVALGVTAWQDASVDADLHAAYRALAGSGELIASVVGALWWERESGVEQIEGFVEQRQQAVGRYRPMSVKVMLDGVAENYTAAMLDPFLDADGALTDNRGIDFVEPDTLPAIVTALDAEGFQVHFHAIGDRAVRGGLDAVEAARQANGPSGLRHHMAHIQFVHPDDLPRFAALGVVANAQPYWACADGYQTELTIPFVGPERAGQQYPFGSLLRHGATLAMGSDWPVSTADPLHEIAVAVERRLPGDDEAPDFHPHERITLGDAFTAFTAGSAFVNHREDTSGTVEPGKEADLVVLDGDPLDPGAGSLSEVRVDMTTIGGAVVYERKGSV